MRTLECTLLVLITLTLVTWIAAHPRRSNRTPLEEISLIRKVRDAGRDHGPSGPSRQGPSGQRYSGQGPSGSGPSGQGPSGSGPSGQGPSGSGPSGQGPSGSGPSGQGPSGPGPSRSSGSTGGWSSGGWPPGPSGPPAPIGPDDHAQEEEEDWYQGGSEHGGEEEEDDSVSDEWFQAWWSMIDQGGEQHEEGDYWSEDDDTTTDDHHDNTGGMAEDWAAGEDYWGGDDQDSTTDPHHATGGTGVDDSGIHWAGDATGDYMDPDTMYHDDISSEGTTTQGPVIADVRLRAPDARLDGPPGSVCSREVQESEWRDESVGYPCWQKERVNCWHCGRDCRTSSHGRCYTLTRNTCYSQERRCSQVWRTKYYCCPGYQQHGYSCVREQQSSECEVQNGGCEHFCRAGADGRRRCECFNGYRLVDGTRCEDLNECEVGNGFCNQHCENTEGSYYCTCRNGYRLTDTTTCTEIDECSTSNGGCAHQCYNTEGAFYCECDAGFTRLNGFQCQDIDECAMGGHCSHRCDNLPGGYLCSCPSNMRLSKADNKTCLGLSVVDPSAVDPNTGSLEPVLVDEEGGQAAQTTIAIIAGGAGGGVVLICLIVLLVYIGHRSRNADSSNTRSGGRDGAAVSSSQHGGYQSAPRVPKGGATTRDPVHFENHGYEKVDYPSPKPPPVNVLPPGVHCEPYLEPTSPPSYMEATAPPAPEVHSYMALAHSGNVKPTPAPPSEAYLSLGYDDTQMPAPNIYEPMDYGNMTSGYADRDVSRYGNRTPSPPPPRPSQIANAGTPSPPRVPQRSPVAIAKAPASSPRTKPKAEGPAPIDTNQLANAMKNLKKVKK